MQFMVLAYDATDSGALERRMAVRQQHMETIDQLKAQGHMHIGAALLDGDKMVGSVIIADFPSRADLDAWLEKEPYITGKVWEKITITPCRLGPSFQK